MKTWSIKPWQNPVRFVLPKRAMSTSQSKRFLPSSNKRKSPKPIGRLEIEEVLKVEAFRQRRAKDLFVPPNRTIGLAISGGVDSMALAVACSKLPKYKFHAFVVDHGARKGSEQEAEAVKCAVTKLGIPTSVLTLAWPNGENPSDLSNFETSARTQRYQALGQACVQRGISSLWVAHHMDDQIETFFMRLTTGHSQSGLMGMRPFSEIPECFGIYGVSQSGLWGQAHTISDSGQTDAYEKDLLNPPHRCMNFEQGGVKIFRPFLSFSKSRLIDTCKENSVAWFEDHTNTDKTFTKRNAIRYLFSNHSVPLALRSRNIWQIMTLLANNDADIQKEADRIYDLFHITAMNLTCGMMDVRMPPSLEGKLLHPEASMRALRRLVEHVTPKANVSTSNMASICNAIWPRDATPLKKPQHRQSTFTSSGVLLQRRIITSSQQQEFDKDIIKGLDPIFYWQLRRQPFSPREKQRLSTTFPPMSSSSSTSAEHLAPWLLWDGRYWIRIWNNLPAPVYVRELRKTDLSEFRKSLDRSHSRLLKQELEKNMKGDVRFTLPAIVMGDEAKGEKSQVLALPSIGVYVPKMFFNDGPISYKILYKQVNLRPRVKSTDAGKENSYTSTCLSFTKDIK